MLLGWLYTAASAATLSLPSGEPEGVWAASAAELGLTLASDGDVQLVRVGEVWWLQARAAPCEAIAYPPPVAAADRRTILVGARVLAQQHEVLPTFEDDAEDPPVAAPPAPPPEPLPAPPAPGVVDARCPSGVNVRPWRATAPLDGPLDVEPTVGARPEYRIDQGVPVVRPEGGAGGVEGVAVDLGRVGQEPLLRIPDALPRTSGWVARVGVKGETWDLNQTLGVRGAFAWRAARAWTAGVEVEAGLPNVELQQFDWSWNRQYVGARFGTAGLVAVAGTVGVSLNELQRESGGGAFVVMPQVGLEAEVCPGVGAIDVCGWAGATAAVLPLTLTQSGEVVHVVDPLSARVGVSIQVPVSRAPPPAPAAPPAPPAAPTPPTAPVPPAPASAP